MSLISKKNETPDSHFDCIVIGAGIAGASVAAELSAHKRVLLLEQESQPGYHTTGRSAALYTVAYGPPVIRALTRASGAFFHNTPGLDGRTSLLHPRGALFIARGDQKEALARLQEDLGTAVKPISVAEIETAVPLLRSGYVASGLIDRTACDIDVNALHQCYLRRFKSAGGQLLTNMQVTDLSRGGNWSVSTSQAHFTAPIVVNAAGAWADEIAVRAGVKPKGLAPKMRTALVVTPPQGIVPDAWPMVVDVAEEFYLKGDAGNLLISPADEVPSPPCDAQPDEFQVALCVDRIQRAFDIEIKRIHNKWAGLRSFLPDGSPIAAYEPSAPGFFWLAGQGGYGIQTAPALARAAAALIELRPLPEDISAEGVTEAELGAKRAGLAA